METNILNIIRTILQKQFMVHTGNISLKDSLYKDLDINSHELMEMLLYVEDRFHIDVNNEEAVKIKTVGDLVYCVQRKFQ